MQSYHIDVLLKTYDEKGKYNFVVVKNRQIVKQSSKQSKNAKATL